MAGTAASILEHLAAVERERVRRVADPVLAASVRRVKAFQQQRFRKTYADQLVSPRYGAAARFFLDELYGPHDFTQRDAQFARIVPALVRLFPQDIVDTVDVLAALHALSESLDTAMGQQLGEPDANLAATSGLPAAGDYLQAWQACARRDDREEQIELTLRVGRSLDRYTRKPLLRHSLKVMRGPARAAGLSALQQFLESGFDTFSTMRGADDFLGTIGQRERALALCLFEARRVARPGGAEGFEDGVLGQLP